MSGYVYFIQAGDGGPVKIGWTRVLLRRLGNLQTGNHQKLRVIGWFGGSQADEATVHGYFSPDCIRGEWFDWSMGLEWFARSAESDHTAPPEELLRRTVITCNLITALENAGPPRGTQMELGI